MTSECRVRRILRVETKKNKGRKPKMEKKNRQCSHSEKKWEKNETEKQNPLKKTTMGACVGVGFLLMFGMCAPGDDALAENNKGRHPR